MLDQNKRRTLKILGVTPLISLPAIAIAANHATTVNSTLPELPAAKPRTGMPLDIQIIDTSEVPDNNVVLRNTSNETLLVTRFMPGHIYYNGQIMDLNEAIGQQPLKLHAGQSKSFDFKVWSVLNAGPDEYVWADDAVERLNKNTSIIKLGAFMADTNAVVYANTVQAIAS